MYNYRPIKVSPPVYNFNLGTSNYPDGSSTNARRLFCNLHKSGFALLESLKLFLANISLSHDYEYVPNTLVIKFLKTDFPLEPLPINTKIYYLSHGSAYKLLDNTVKI